MKPIMRQLGTWFGLGTVACLLLAIWALWTAGLFEGPAARTVRTTSVYTQCPKALVRSHLWDAGRHRDPADLPSVGAIMQAIVEGSFDGAAYDRAYPERMARTLY